MMLTAKRKNKSRGISAGEPKWVSECLVAIRVWLVRAFSLDADVLGLLLCQLCKLGAESWEVEASYLLIQVLWQQVDIVLVLLGSISLLPVSQQVQLSQSLIGERARHHKGWMASGASQVQETTGCQHDDAVAVRENISINLRLDVFDFDALCSFESSHIDF